MEIKEFCWGSSLILLILSTWPSDVYGGPHERRLLNDLLEHYNTLERPVYNESEPLTLLFGLTLQQIIDVDEKNQLLTTNVWLNLEWNDINMKWNKSEYGNIEDIRMPPSKLWKPDVLMYNSADEAFDGTYPTNVVVTHEGRCTYIPPGIFKSTCKIDITWFPFDDQDCEMKFGSWTYNGFKLDLNMNNDKGEGDMSTFVLNGEWHLLGVPGKRNEVYYDCCPEPYLDVTFVIKIRRRTLYYFFNLIVPCVLIASMAVLGFTLPPDSGEKLSLGVTVLLSLTVFQQSISDAMPVTSLQIPLLGVTILLSLTVFLNMVSTLMPVSSDNPLLGVTILLSLTVFSQVLADTMPATSDAVPLLGVTVLLSLTVFSIMVTEMLPKVSDAVPILGVTIMLSITIFATIVGEMLPVSDATPLIGVAIMLSITIFATIVGEMLPVSDATPLIGTYFNCIMFMVASSVVTTIMILNYHHRLADTHEMPNWVRCVFLQWIPWALRMGRPGEKITRKTIMMQNKMKELDLKERSSKSLLANVLDMDDDFRPSSTLPHIHPHHPSHTHPPGMGNNSSGPNNVNNSFARVPSSTGGLPSLPGMNSSASGDREESGSFPPGAFRELSLILKELRVITDKIRDDEDTAAIENDWKFAAMVLDRVCLLTFTAFTIIATIAVLVSAPHIIVT